MIIELDDSSSPIFLSYPTTSLKQNWSCSFNYPNWSCSFN